MIGKIMLPFGINESPKIPTKVVVIGLSGYVSFISFHALDNSMLTEVPVSIKILYRLMFSTKRVTTIASM